jgi:hypothetical protein
VGPDPQKWPEDDILYMLAHFGHDTAGNYIIGEPAYRRHLEAMQQGLATTSEAGYPALATAAMQAGDAGSSAGGEFPKFTAFPRACRPSCPRHRQILRQRPYAGRAALV